MGSDVDSRSLRERAKRGVVFLGARTVAVQLITLGGNIALARRLTPAEFGTFGVVQFVLSLFTLLGDVGLGAALIQRRELPSERDLSSVFWVQLAFAGVVVGLVFGFSPWVVGFWPDLPPDAVNLLRMLSLSFVFVMLRAVPSVLLERQLSFGKLAVLEFSSTLGFYATATLLAYRDYGVEAMLWAVLTQAIVGAGVAYVLRPWLPRLAFHWSFVRSILSYGVAYQAKNLVGFAHNALIPLVVGRSLGTAAVGYVTWAQSAANQPLRIVQLLARVNFPLLSRVQDQPDEFKRFAERGIQVGALVAYAFVALCLGLGEPLVRLIYGERWLTALPMFYVFSASMGAAFIAPLAASALEAIGKPRLVAALSLAWVILNWIVVSGTMLVVRTPLAFALAYSVHVLVGNFLLLLALRREVTGFAVGRVLGTSAIAAVCAAIVARWFTPAAASAVWVTAMVLVTVTVYALLVTLTNLRLVAGLVRTARR